MAPANRLEERNTCTGLIMNKQRIKLLVFWGIGTIIVLLLMLELFLRCHYGLCDAVLMRADDEYEYIAKPSQKRKRLGHTVIYNSQSMRNEELLPDSLRILCLGDSILNGGTITDQKHLATSIMSSSLSDALGAKVQVLNVSAGSWGPDNCLAWLKRHGDFGAKGIVLVVSSHDVHDTMTFVPVVGILKSYPSRQYPLAVLELWDRYLFPQSKVFSMTKDEIDDSFRKEHHIEATNVAFNPGFQGLLDYANEHGLPFAIFLHATLFELNKGVYDADGQAIIDFCQKNHIPLIQDLGHGLTRECIYKNDYLHYSKEGHALMAKLLLPFCHETLIKEKR